MRAMWAIALSLPLSLAGLTVGRAQSSPSTPASRARKPASVAPVTVKAGRRDDTPAKLDHILPEVAGTKITVTKKTNTTKLDQQPPVLYGDLQQLFARTPGLLVGEAQTLTQFNLSYRGLGAPQQSDFVLALQDGLPITTDWIGQPTLAYLPFPEAISEVQEIRAGSGLIDGPEPVAINLVSKRAPPGEPFSGESEQVGGGGGLYSSFNVLQGSRGKVDIRADVGYLRFNGQRQNAQSEVREADLLLDYRPDGRQRWGLDLHAYDADSGDPGSLGFTQFRNEPSYSPTPDNEDWVSRYSVTLSHDRDFAGGWRFEGRLWAAYQDQAARAAPDQTPGAPPLTTTVQDQPFRSEGADLRLRDRWGRGNAFTIGIEVYHDDAPLRQWTSTDLLAGRDDHSGTAILNQARQSSYQAVFAETVFRLPWRFHLVPSVRIDHAEVSVDETLRPPVLTRPLIEASANRAAPLLGLGFGNDFGRQNETYFSVTQGWRPLTFQDIAPTFSNLTSSGLADPSKSVSYEAGVHGTPVAGLFYDAGVFWVDLDHRIETLAINALDAVEQDSGDSRNRGFEGEVSYDALAQRPGGRHLTAFANLQLLDARFTRSDLPDQVGRVPAFAPHALAKYGLTYRAPNLYRISLTGVSVSSQYVQDSDLPSGYGPTYVPAKLGGYTVLNVTADWRLSQRLRLLGGVNNLGDVRYTAGASRIGIEPALRRTLYAGLALGF